MNKKFSLKSKEGVEFRCSWLILSLVSILFFTSFNGYFDSIDYEYGATDYWQCTFLGDMDDAQADLLKGAMSLASSPPPDLWNWSPHYKKFYENNPYGKLDSVSRGRLTIFGLTPFTVLILTAIRHATWLTSPEFMVALFYLSSLALLGLACWCFVENLLERALAFVALALSYPYMMMLTRGNFGATIVGVLLVLYIYLTCNRRHVMLATICLALACNIRPNAILLAPLLLCFGFRNFVVASAVFLFLAGAFAAICYSLVATIYPGYSYHTFLQALSIYQNIYIVGPSGDGNNNSAYGMFKVIYNIIFLEPFPDLLLGVNKLIFLINVGLIAFVSYKFWKKQLPVWYFAFTLVSFYILASTIFATYHLLVLYAFILLAGLKSSGDEAVAPELVLMSALLIIPKNYLYVSPGVSCEVLLNPLILSVCVWWILSRKFPTQGELQPQENSVDNSPEVRTKRRRR